MTKLRIMSDLHLEFGPLDIQPIGENALILAGDIATYTDGAATARDYARAYNIPVVMIAGNHEFYRVKWGAPTDRPIDYTIDSTIAALRAVADTEPLLHFLENDTAIVAGIQFIGCTLWTDFALNGDATLGMLRAAKNLNDYNLIQEEDGRFKPKHARQRHMLSLGVLREKLRTRSLDNLPRVVITHHLPSARSLDGRYNNESSCAYASSLDNLVADSGAAVWVHGHTHVSKDYWIGNTRIVCNPRGYYGDELNSEFNPDLIVEVGT